uniref:CRE-FLP-12 protein n=1 Tax=Bursaphelenchus xylophilus TaxID=6326 RepID=A0A1I7SRV4_BURXY
MNSQTLLMLCCTLALQFAYYVDAAAFLRQDKDKSAPAVVENANQQYISPGQEQVVESAPEAELPAQKRAQTFVRFGKRAQTFVRFGKRAQTFVRFG